VSNFLDDVMFDDIDVSDEEIEEAVLNASSLAADYDGELFDSRRVVDVFGYDEGIDFEAIDYGD
jgi:hypothetical protein